jgi:iron complex outermembrane receptor protein
VGSKFEHNAYTGFEYEPGVKLLWQPTPRQAVWISANRAIVQTSREQANLIVDQYTFPTQGGGFGVAEVIGNPETKVERLFDFEMGYRVQVNKRFSLDIATFSSFYNNVSGIVPQEPFFTQDEGPPHLVIPYVFEYVADAHTYGAEIAGIWNVSRRWRLSPSLSTIQLVTKNSGNSLGPIEDEDNTPQLQAQIRSSVDLTKNLDWDLSVNHVGRLRDGGDGAVPAYNRVDTRVGWRVGEFVELSLVGQNLLTPLHAEFHNAYEVRRTLVERTVFAKITWRF